MHDNKGSDVRSDLRKPLIVCVIFGMLLLGASVLIAYTVPREHFWKFAVFLLGVYVMIVGITLLSCLIRYQKAERAKKESNNNTQEVGDLFRYVIDLPYAIMDETGLIKIASGELQKILSFRNPVCNVPINSFCTVPIEHIIYYAREGKPFVEEKVNDAGTPENTVVSMQTEIKNRMYDVKAHVMHSHGKEYYFVIFQDITELLNTKREQYEDDPIVAYIVMDSLQELAQYIRVSYSTAVSEVESRLKDWAKSLGGVLREYDREKYMMVFTRVALDQCENDDFPILDTIRSIKIGDNSFPMTISMGVGAVEGTMEEKGDAASRALDIALQKGGDQVCVNHGDKFKFHGGHVNTMYGSDVVTSRVNSTYLQKLIREAGNVLIMGHRNPDYDSIGSCVGLARLAICTRGSAAKIRIVINREHDNFRTCYDMLAGLSEYRSMFISADTALDAVRSDTLLILSDVNSSRNVESPQLLQRVQNIAVIDHHRRDVEKDRAYMMLYINPQAAAACELVSQMLDQSPYGEDLVKEEANLMLAGLMLDTKNFTSGAKLQTFEAVHYLYHRHATVDAVSEFFNESVADRLQDCNIGMRTRIYRDKIAITWLSVDRPETEADTIAVAKAADKLMRLDGIEASFALLRADNRVRISARSKDRINVQMIMNTLGGGGHFNMAGAMLDNTNLEKASQDLKKAIDQYLLHDYGSESQRHPSLSLGDTPVRSVLLQLPAERIYHQERRRAGTLPCPLPCGKLS